MYLVGFSPPVAVILPWAVAEMEVLLVMVLFVVTVGGLMVA